MSNPKNSPVWFWDSRSTVSLVWDWTTTLVVVSNVPWRKPSVVGALPGLFLSEVLTDIASSSSLLTWSSKMDALLDWSRESSLSLVFGRSCEPLGLVGVVGMGATLLNRFRGDIGLFGVVCCWAGFLLLKIVSLRRSCFVHWIVKERERGRERGGMIDWLTIKRRLTWLCTKSDSPPKKKCFQKRIKTEAENKPKRKVLGMGKSQLTLYSVFWLGEWWPRPSLCCTIFIIRVSSLSHLHTQYMYPSIQAAWKERRLSPPMQPGYEARFTSAIGLQCKASVSHC